MFIFNQQIMVTPNTLLEFGSQRTHVEDLNRAIKLYDRVSLKGRLGRVVDFLLKRDSHLLDLNHYRKSLHLQGQHYAGIKPVKIEKIRGTQGKRSDFNSRFIPQNENMRSRWLKIAIAWILGTPLPPIELIQVGEIYFIVDGHHRISVAIALGEEEIDAEVTTWNVNGPLPWEQNEATARLMPHPA